MSASCISERSKNRITSETLKLLLQLAEESGLRRASTGDLVTAAGVPKEKAGILVDEQFGGAVLRDPAAQGYCGPLRQPAPPLRRASG